MKRRAFLGWLLGATVAVAGRVWGSCGQEDEPGGEIFGPAPLAGKVDLSHGLRCREPRQNVFLASDGWRPRDRRPSDIVMESLIRSRQPSGELPPGLTYWIRDNPAPS